VAVCAGIFEYDLGGDASELEDPPHACNGGGDSDEHAGGGEGAVVSSVSSDEVSQGGLAAGWAALLHNVRDSRGGGFWFLQGDSLSILCSAADQYSESARRQYVSGGQWTIQCRSVSSSMRLVELSKKE
jgi:hypothetical protein